MSAKRILLLLPTTTYRAGAFMQASMRLDMEIVVGVDQRQSLFNLNNDTLLYLDFTDTAKSLQKVAALHRAKPLNAVMGVDEETVELAGRAAQALGLPHNPVASLRAARFKHLMRAALAQGGLLSPRFRVYATGAGAPENIQSDFDLPVVLKPLFLSASRGVIRADTPQEFKTAFQRLTRYLERPEIAGKSPEFKDRILVENYIPGKEVAVEGILQEGRLSIIAIFDKPDPLEGPCFAETIYVTPSRLAADEQKAVKKTTGQAARALGLKDGPIHAEMRINREGVWMVEMAARSIGGFCSRVLRFEGGQSLEDVLLRQAAGELPQIPNREKDAVAEMMMPVEKSGILRSVENVREAKQVPGVEDVMITIPCGRGVQALPEGAQYLGFIFARAERPAEAEQAVRKAFQCLKICIE